MAETYTFSAVTATDRAGIVWVAAILSLMFSVITLATRVQIKLHTLGSDDWLILGATILAIGQYAAIYSGLENGVGRSTELLSKEDAAELGKSVLASEVLYIIALALSKLSVVFFMRRLFTRDHRAAWWSSNVAIGLTVVWGVASCLAIGVGCGPSTILYGEERCSGKVRATRLMEVVILIADPRVQILRWSFVAAFDAVSEIIYVGVATLLVSPLQMTTYIKATVVAAFTFRLLSAAFAAMHAVWISRYAGAANPGLAIANVLVWQQVHIGYSLIASTIPTLKSFIRGYNKAMGWDPTYAKHDGGFEGGYNLGSIMQSHAVSRNHDGEYPLGLRPKDGDYNVGAYHDASANKAMRRTSDAPSGASEDPIIRRDILVTVEHDRSNSFVR